MPWGISAAAMRPLPFPGISATSKSGAFMLASADGEGDVPVELDGSIDMSLIVLSYAIEGPNAILPEVEDEIQVDVCEGLSSAASTIYGLHCNEGKCIWHLMAETMGSCDEHILPQSGCFQRWKTSLLFSERHSAVCSCSIYCFIGK